MSDESLREVNKKIIVEILNPFMDILRSRGYNDAMISSFFEINMFNFLSFLDEMWTPILQSRVKKALSKARKQGIIGENDFALKCLNDDDAVRSLDNIKRSIKDCQDKLERYCGNYDDYVNKQIKKRIFNEISQPIQNYLYELGWTPKEVSKLFGFPQYPDTGITVDTPGILFHTKRAVEEVVKLRMFDENTFNMYLFTVNPHISILEFHIRECEKNLISYHEFLRNYQI